MVSFLVVFLFLVFANGFVDKVTVLFSCLENGADATAQLMGKTGGKSNMLIS
jgi:hypothetical protein